MKTVYMALVYCGDGSGTPNWFESKEVLTQAEEAFPEKFWLGSEEYHFPDDFDFKACGINFSDKDLLDRLNGEWYGDNWSAYLIWTWNSLTKTV